MLSRITQISYDEFEYWKRELKELEASEKSHEYPPRFQIRCIRSSITLNLKSVFVVNKRNNNNGEATIGQFVLNKIVKGKIYL